MILVMCYLYIHTHISTYVYILTQKTFLEIRLKRKQSKLVTDMGGLMSYLIFNYYLISVF